MPAAGLGECIECGGLRCSISHCSSNPPSHALFSSTGPPDVDAIRAVRRQSQQAPSQQYMQPPATAAIPQQQQASYSMHSSVDSQAAGTSQQQAYSYLSYAPTSAMPTAVVHQQAQQQAQYQQQQQYQQQYMQQYQAAAQRMQHPPAPHLPVSMSDLDLVAAVAEEVTVYDLQRSQDLEVQQAAAAAEAVARRASQAQAEAIAAAAAASKPGPAASPRRLSYYPPMLPAPPASSRPPSVAAAAAATPPPVEPALRRPMTAVTALRRLGHLLTPYEQSEVLSFTQVWFVGKPGATKIKGAPGMCVRVHLESMERAPEGRLIWMGMGRGDGRWGR